MLTPNKKLGGVMLKKLIKNDFMDTQEYLDCPVSIRQTMLPCTTQPSYHIVAVNQEKNEIGGGND